jgi:hypothetical protein
LRRRRQKREKRRKKKRRERMTKRKRMRKKRRRRGKKRKWRGDLGEAPDKEGPHHFPRQGPCEAVLIAKGRERVAIAIHHNIPKKTGMIST